MMGVRSIINGIDYGIAVLNGRQKRHLQEAEDALDVVASSLSSLRASLADLRRYQEIPPLDAYVKLFNHAREWNTDRDIQKLVHNFERVRGQHPAKVALNELQELFDELTDPANGWNKTNLYTHPMDDDHVYLSTDLVGTYQSRPVSAWKGENRVLDLGEYTTFTTRMRQQGFDVTSNTSQVKDAACAHAHIFVSQRVDNATKEIDRVLGHRKQRMATVPVLANGS